MSLSNSDLFYFLNNKFLFMNWPLEIKYMGVIIIFIIFWKLKSKMTQMSWHWCKMEEQPAFPLTIWSHSVCQYRPAEPELTVNERWSLSQSSVFCSILGLFTVCLGRASCVELIELWRFGDMFTCEPVKVCRVAFDSIFYCSFVG